MLKVLVQIPVGFLLLVWPMAVMMSAMAFDAPGSTSNKSLILPLTALFFYPVLFGVAFYYLNWSFSGFSPRTFLILSIAVPLTAFVVFGYPRIFYNMLRGVRSDGYFKNESAVYYEGHAIEGADPGTFAVLGESYSGYARDRAHAYFHGKPIVGANAASFAVVVAGADKQTTSYWRDASHIFHEGRVVDGADAASFVALHIYGYAHDGERVFYQGKLIEEADAASLRLLTDSFAVDKARIYFLGKAILPEADVATFEVYPGNQSYGHDRNKVYALPTQLFAEAKEIAGADLATFTPLSRTYSKDAQHVYSAEQTGAVVLAGADAASFEVTEWDQATQSEARDKHRHYLRGKVVEQSPQGNRINP